MEASSGPQDPFYIQALFRTITLNDLKEQLKMRQIVVPRNATYYTMTLKLRLSILVTSNSCGDIQCQLRDELGAMLEVKVGYVCSIVGCSFKSKNYNFLLNHLKSMHSTTSQKIVCQLHNCNRELSSVKMLLLHIKNLHRARKNKVNIKHSQVAEEISSFKCLLVSCNNQKVKTIKELKAHLFRHTDKSESTECIFQGCTFVSTVTGTMKTHFSKKHQLQQIFNLKKDICEPRLVFR